MCILTLDPFEEKRGNGYKLSSRIIIWIISEIGKAMTKITEKRLFELIRLYDFY